MVGDKLMRANTANASTDPDRPSVGTVASDYIEFIVKGCEELPSGSGSEST